MALARLRCPVAESRGRRYPELPHPYRTDFQRDRDRIVHARAFRRLENKTQVFTAGMSDHFRNRLTHTIEVAQIARTAAAVLGLDEDLTEALSLVHDVGHPPFAHAGEDELDRQMRKFGERFDHNLHALRIVESFENRYARFPGLNLTFEVREGIVKHSRDYQPGKSPEADEYLPGLCPPLEAQLIDLADEIAYNTADLDDAYSAGMFTIAELSAAVPVFAEAFEYAAGHYPGAPERVQFYEANRVVIDTLVSGLVNGTASAAAGVETPYQVRRHPRRLAGFTSEAQAANRELKQFLHHAVYFSEALIEERSRSARRIAEMFAILMADSRGMPETYRDEAAGQPLHRQVCDYIAGMTDGFFLRTYAHLTGAGEPSPA